MIHTDFFSEKWIYADNKVIIFGGTGGLGSQIANEMSNNWEVAKVGSRHANVTDAKAVNNLISLSDADVIINMSGFNSSSFLHKVDTEEGGSVDDIIEVNIRGNINILRSALPQMRKNGYGRIILASSVLAHKTVLGTSVYAASKSFLDTLVRVAAAENAAKGITINTLRMGYFDGGMTMMIPDEERFGIQDQIPAGKFGNITDITALIECIIQSEYINGSNIDINGGLNGL